MTAPDRAVVVTGLGVASPWGVGLDAFRAGLAAGGATPGDMAAFEAKDHLGPKGLRGVDRVSRLALVAAQEALAASGLAGEGAARDDVGVVLGSAFSGLDSIMGFFAERLAEGANYVTASNFGNIVMNAAASQVALRFGLPRLNATIASGAASGADALGWALDLVRAGRAPLALAGGVEEASPAARAVLAARGRAPATLGEGAAFLVLEDAAHARARGATALATIHGYGQAFDPAGALGRAADPAPAARAIAAALADAGLAAGDVDLVVGCAGGTPALDALEAAALAAAGLAATPRLAPKTWLGEGLGAHGAFAALAAVLALGGAPLPGGAARPAMVLIDALDADGHQAALVLGPAP